MHTRTGRGRKKIRGRLAYIPAPADLPPTFGKRFRIRVFGDAERTAAPGHVEGWYLVARSKATASYALVDLNQAVIAQASRIPMTSLESGEPHAAIVEALCDFAQPIVYADVDPIRRPRVGYIGWLGTEGRGPSHIAHRVHDGTTTITTAAVIRYGNLMADPIGTLKGEMTVYRALDGEPTTDTSFVLNLQGAPTGQIDIQLPIEAAGALVKLITALVAAGRRDGLLPQED